MLGFVSGAVSAAFRKENGSAIAAKVIARSVMGDVLGLILLRKSSFNDWLMASFCRSALRRFDFSLPDEQPRLSHVQPPDREVQ